MRQGGAGLPEPTAASTSVAARAAERDGDRGRGRPGPYRRCRGEGRRGSEETGEEEVGDEERRWRRAVWIAGELGQPGGVVIDLCPGRWGKTLSDSYIGSTFSPGCSHEPRLKVL